MFSNGMVLSAISDKGDVIELLRPCQGSKAGDRIKLDGYDLSKDLPQIVNANKQKKILGFLKTDNESIACFNTMKLKNMEGLISVKSLRNSSIS